LSLSAADFLALLGGDVLTKSIPGSSGHYFAEEGHMSIWLNHLEEIAKDISSK